MSSSNTPTPSQTYNFQHFGIPHEQKFRSMTDLMKISKPVRTSANSRPALPNKPGPQVPPKEKCRSMEDIMKRAKSVVTPHVYYSQLSCNICGSGDKEEEMLLCDDCDNGFHMKCLRPLVSQVPLGTWLCDGCGPPNKSTGNKASKSRKRFFQIIEYISSEGPKRQLKRIRSGKNGTKLLPYIPSDCDERGKRQLDSLRSALEARNLEFSDELTYPEDMAPRSANQSLSECDDMQVLSKENKLTIEKCKEMNKRGKCPPLRVVFDAQEGYRVEADGLIKAMTFISEYTGDVDFANKRKNQEIDSFMTLLTFRDSSDGDGLLICPDKCGNISRFISGINNHSTEGRKKKNLKSVRYNVDGECRVFLIAIRDIKEGERLYYDYNGQDNAYPTEHFI